MAETTFNDRDRLWELIKDMRFGMFTLRQADGQLRDGEVGRVPTSFSQGQIE